MKNTGNTIVASDGTTAVLSESGGAVTFTADAAIIEGSSSGDLVRITQTGSGNALVVEDSANPDSTPFVVTASGTVGIGTSSTSATLDISAIGPVLKLTDTTSTASYGWQSISNVFRIYDFTASQERMRIDSSGRIGIGRSTVASVKVMIQSGGESYLMIMRNSSGVDQLQIESDGDIRNVNNSYGVISDIKLKENITDANNQWNDIKNLRVVNFNFTEASGYSQHRQIGFVAQEVELVSPSLVSESIDRDEAGNELGTVTKSVRSSIIFIKAVKALQEAMDRIESQQSQIDALTAKIQEQDLTIASLISRIEALETT
jgi:hypothetical protein